MSRAEYTQNQNIRIRLFNEYFLLKRNTPQPVFWRRLIERKNECAFEGITAEDLLLSEFMTAIRDTKLGDKLMKEKSLN